MTRLRCTVLISLSLAFACGDDDVEMDAGMSADSATDAGPGVDAPGFDAGPSADAGPAFDGGPGFDGGPDAGPTSDAGSDGGPSCDDGVQNGDEEGVDCGGSCEACPPAVPLVIFDTDMGPDIDDVLALSMLHSYQDEGVIEIAAVTVSRNSDLSGEFSDALNTFYGRPDIPVGVYRGNTGAPYDRFAALASRYPHDVQNIEDGYIVQRRVLADAAARGRRVLVIQVGFSGNLSSLLNSEGDAISPMNGVDLVSATVDLLSIMAGNFGSSRPEFNVENDLPAAQNLFRRWPVAMAVSDWRVGGYLHFPYSAIRDGFAADHPVRASYEYEDLSWHEDAPPFYNMKSWDLTSVLEAIEPDADYFDRSATGTVSLDGAGASTFAEGPGQHYILADSRAYSEAQSRAIIDRMIALVR